MASQRTVRSAASMVVWLALLVGLAQGAEAAVRRTVTLDAAPTTVTAGQPVTLSGKVSQSGKGTPVLVELRRGSRWSLVTTVRTTKRGTYSALVNPASAGAAAYRARVKDQKVGSRTLAAATSPTRTVTVEAAEVSRSVTLTVPGQLVASEVTTLTGSITKTPAKLIVSIECRLPGQPWDPCGAGTTTAGGTFTDDEFQIHQVGNYQVRAAVPEQKTASATLGAAVSSAGTMRVYGADNTGPTKLVSITREDNFTATEASSGSSVSGNGGHVAFISRSAELVEGVDPGEQPNVFLRDVRTGTTTLVSVDLGGGPMEQIEWYDPVEVDVSATGRYVAFTSSAPDLVDGDTNGHTDVFVRDRVAGTTTLVSRSSAGAIASGDPLLPFEGVSISDDGQKVLFTSRISLTPQDTNGFTDVYLRDLVAGTTTLVTRNASGEPLVRGGHTGALSGNGSHAVFYSSSSDIAPTAGDPHPAGLYRKNLTTGAVDTIFYSGNDVNAGGPSNVDVSTSGARVAYAWGVALLWDSASKTSVTVSDNIDDESELAGTAFISGDGSTVAFSSAELDFVPSDDRGDVLHSEVYLYDVASEAISLGSVTSHGEFGGAGFFGGSSSATGLSDNGRYLAFDSDSGWLIPGDDSNFVSDVFVRDLAPS
jgi:hypothetical protein